MITYDEAVAYIGSIPKFTKKTEMANTEKMLELLGVDRSRMEKKVIHVAGTNGKGSVCAYMAGILEELGYRTGLFTSPHLIDLEERIQIHQEQVSREIFIEAFQRVKEISLAMQQEGYLHPAYFEFLFGMAMWIYQEADVDYLVLETGLGGKLDSTNVFETPLLTIITSIGYDHTELLGDTLEKIAEQKAGIIKEGVPLVYWGSDETVTKVMEDTAKFKDAPAYKVTESDYKILKITNKSIDFCMDNGYYGDSTFSLPFPASYQAANGAIALRAIEVLEKKEPVNGKLIASALLKVRWPGRMEEILPRVFVDGAHNEAGITAFIDAVQRMPQSGRKVLLFSVVKEKEIEPMIKRLCEELDFQTIILTEVKGSRRTDTETLAGNFTRYTAARIMQIAGTEEALEYGIACKGEQGTLYCAGSLYLVGQIKAAVKNREGHYD